MSLVEFTDNAEHPFKIRFYNRNAILIIEAHEHILNILYEQELAQKRLELNAAKVESTHWIERIADPDLRTVLLLRYVELRKWEDIAMIMCMSERWVYLKHGEALRMFETVNARQLAQRPP